MPDKPKNICDSLTPEQDAAIPQYRDKWIGIGTACEPEMRVSTIFEGLRTVYRCGNIPDPTFGFTVQDPKAGLRFAQFRTPLYNKAYDMADEAFNAWAAKHETLLIAQAKRLQTYFATAAVEPHPSQIWNSLLPATPLTPAVGRDSLPAWVQERVQTILDRKFYEWVIANEEVIRQAFNYPENAKKELEGMGDAGAKTGIRELLKELHAWHERDAQHAEEFPVAGAVATMRKQLIEEFPEFVQQRFDHLWALWTQMVEPGLWQAIQEDRETQHRPWAFVFNPYFEMSVGVFDALFLTECPVTGLPENPTFAAWVDFLDQVAIEGPKRFRYDFWTAWQHEGDNALQLERIVSEIVGDRPKSEQEDTSWQVEIRNVLTEFFKSGQYTNNAIWPAIYGSHEAWWLSSYDVFENLLGCDLGDHLDGLRHLVYCCGWVWAYEDMAIMGPKPVELHRNERGLHNPNGPAVRYPSGWSVWFIDGIALDEKIIMHPEQLTAAEILGESNAEKRRIMLARHGLENFIDGLLKDGHAMEKQTDDFGTLYRIDQPGDETLALIELINSTMEPDGTFERYLLRVPPSIQTAQEGVAWTFAQTSDAYRPAVET